MSNNPYKEVRKNSLIIAVANLGSRMIGFIMAPLYSYYLTTAEYGSMDLILTTVGLLLPFICLDIYDAAFRYALDKSYGEKTVFSTTFAVSLAGNAILLLGFSVCLFLPNIPDVVFVCLLYACLETVSHVITQYVRGKGQMITFALSGVVGSVAMLLANLLFLIVLTLGLKGWIYSFFFARIMVLIFVAIRAKIWQEFSLFALNKGFFLEALRFCLPLIPSASMWWIMNASDRYVVTMFAGLSATGIYAVANKFPHILSFFESAFYQAWQTTAINTAESAERDKIYSRVFFLYFQVLCIGSMGILIILKPMLICFFAKEYHTAWLCSSVLVIGVMVHALAGNLGTIYTVSKSTTGALKTAAIGAVLNIMLNLIFVRLYGLNAAAWTTLVAYLVVLVVRWYDTKAFVNLKLPGAKVLGMLLGLTLQLILYYIPGYLSYAARIAIFAYFAISNRATLLKALKR